MKKELFEQFTHSGYVILNQIDLFDLDYLLDIWNHQKKRFHDFIAEQGDDLNNICTYTALRDRVVDVPHSIWGADIRKSKMWETDFGTVGITTNLGPDYERSRIGYGSRFYWLVPKETGDLNTIEQKTKEYCEAFLEEPVLVDYIGFGYASGNSYVGTHIDAGVKDGLLKFDINLEQQNRNYMLLLNDENYFTVCKGDGYFLSPTMKHCVPPSPGGWRVNFHCNIILTERVEKKYLHKWEELYGPVV